MVSRWREWVARYWWLAAILGYGLLLHHWLRRPGPRQPRADRPNFSESPALLADQAQLDKPVQGHGIDSIEIANMPPAGGLQIDQPGKLPAWLGLAGFGLTGLGIGLVMPFGWPGGYWFAAAGLLLSVGSILRVWLISISHRPMPVCFVPRRWLWLAAPGGLLIVWSALRAPISFPTIWENVFTSLLWLVGLTAVSAAVLLGGAVHSGGQLRKPRPAKRMLPGWLLPLGIFLAAFLLRVIWLPEHPYAIANDEGWIGLEGLRLLRGQAGSLFSVGWSDQPMLSFLPTGLSVLLLGKTAFAVRIISVLEGSLSVLFLFLFMRDQFGLKAALAAGVILAVMPVHQHFSRTGFNNIIPALFGAAAVWAAGRAVKRGETWAYWLSGLIAGFSFYAYIGSRLALPLVFGYFGWAWLMKPGESRTAWKGWLIAAASFACAALPQLAYFASNPEAFVGRLGQESLFLNDWISQEMANTGQSLGQVYWGQFLRSTLVFVTYPAPASFYDSPLPYFNLLFGAAFLTGTILAVVRSNRPGMAVLLGWFWVVVILGGMLTSLAPQNQRLPMSFPAAAGLAGIGLAGLSELLGKVVSARWVYAFLALILAGGAVMDIHFYFGAYRNVSYYGDPANEFIYESSKDYLASADSRPFFMLGRPEVDADFPNFRLFLDGRQRFNLDDAQIDLDAVYWDGGSIYAYSTPEAQARLTQIMAALPDGSLTNVYRKYRPDELLYTKYTLP